MNRQIVNVRAGMNLLIKKHVGLATETALVAAGNHMVRINGLDQCSCLAQPVVKCRLDSVRLRKTSRFIADLPGEYRRIILVRLARHGTHPRDDMADIVSCQ